MSGRPLTVMVFAARLVAASVIIDPDRRRRSRKALGAMSRLDVEATMKTITTEKSLFEILIDHARLISNQEPLPEMYIHIIERFLTTVGNMRPWPTPGSYGPCAEAMLCCSSSASLDKERAAPGPRRAYPLELEKLYRSLVSGYMSKVTIGGANDALLGLLALPREGLVESVKHRSWWLLRTTPIGEQELGAIIAVERNYAVR